MYIILEMEGKNKMDRLVFNRSMNGKSVECEAIATYHDDNSNKDIIIYTDKMLNKDGKLNVYYSYYIMNNNTIELSSIDDSNGKKLALELIKEVISDMK